MNCGKTWISCQPLCVCIYLYAYADVLYGYGAMPLIHKTGFWYNRLFSLCVRLIFIHLHPFRTKRRDLLQRFSWYIHFFGWTFSWRWVCVWMSFSSLPSCVKKIVIARIARGTCIGGTYSGFFEPNSHRRTHRNAKHIVRLFFVAERKKKENMKNKHAFTHRHLLCYPYTTTQHTECLTRNIERAIYHGDIQHFSYGSLWAALFQSVQWRKKTFSGH